MSIKEMFHLHKKKREQVPAKFMRTIKTLKNDYHEQITTLEFQSAIQIAVRACVCVCVCVCVRACECMRKRKCAWTGGRGEGNRVRS